MLKQYADIDNAILICVLILVGMDIYFNVYYGKINQSLGTAIRVIKTGTPSNKVSGFIGVICYIAAVAAVLAAILSLNSSIWKFLSLIANGIAQFCFGHLIFSFKNKMV